MFRKYNDKEITIIKMKSYVENFFGLLYDEKDNPKVVEEIKEFHKKLFEFEEKGMTVKPKEFRA